MRNSFKDLDEPVVIPFKAKLKIQNQVKGQIGFIRFLSDVVDLYIGKAGSVMTGLVSSFDPSEEEEVGHVGDDDELPPTAA